ncbi:Hypothetical predicted protein [Pelobates cultripes]|uniref:Uncharacterized protein n=1 Tax=Pelobates cultripes TaxID=61616 RepID=A0AAD1WHB1_PELCU|nr:Hypothetical predicted protein [Pelobates cultripes]
MSPPPITASDPIYRSDCLHSYHGRRHSHHSHHRAAGHHNIRANARPSPLRPSMPLGKLQPPFPIWPLFQPPYNDTPHCYYYVRRHRHRCAGAHCNAPSNGQRHSQYDCRHIRPPITIWPPSNILPMLP